MRYLVTVKLLVVVATSLSAAAKPSAQSVEINGVKIELYQYAGGATIAVEPVTRFKLKIHLDPRDEQRPVAIRVQLPNTGRNTWPAAEVQVLDSRSQPILVERSGLEWHRLLFHAPAQRSTFLVQATKPARSQPPRLSDQERHATDSMTGLSATVCQWPRGRRAALSIRFDDSHPTHLSKAIPILREYGFKGTFMINPGRPAFLEHKEEWEAIARQGDQEFANHTMHHRGARSDEEMDHEIGDAAKCIHQLFPDGSTLLALNLGGGTKWATTRPMRYYLDKYGLFDASSGSMGMDDRYGDRVEEFRRNLERHIARGGWCRVHYHYIGSGLSTSEENFRAELNIVKEHEGDLWIAGMADIYKYQRERWATRLALKGNSPDRATLSLACLAPSELFNQPLTIKIALPPMWLAGEVRIMDPHSRIIARHRAQSSEKAAILFEAPPVSATYVIERLR